MDVDVQGHIGKGQIALFELACHKRGAKLGLVLFPDSHTIRMGKVVARDFVPKHSHPQQSERAFLPEGVISTFQMVGPTAEILG